MNLPAHFTAKTKRSDCIVWTGALNSRGYPCFAIDGVSQLAHRVAYEAHHGEIPEGLTIDHLCGYTRCVNPDHLEAVTAAENNRRSRDARGYRIGGQCSHGHALTEDSTYRHPRGQLVCRECQRQQQPRNPIRAWAKSNGLPVREVGRIPADVISAYYAAHPDEVWSA